MQEAAIVHSVEHGFPQLLPLGRTEKDNCRIENTYECLGYRVLTKLQSIIRNEMNLVGGQELSLPAIGRKNIWQTSGRKLFQF